MDNNKSTLLVILIIVHYKSIIILTVCIIHKNTGYQITRRHNFERTEPA